MATGSNRKILQQLGPILNLGIELAVIMGVFGVIGWFLDNAFGTSPLLLVVLLVVGAAGGMYRFIRTALKAGVQKTDEKDT